MKHLKFFVRLLGVAMAFVAGPRHAAAAPAAVLDTTFIVVAPDGSGDATTIQDGLSQAVTPPSVVRVMPGFYDEVVQLDPPLGTAATATLPDPECLEQSATDTRYDLILIAPEGPSTTTVHGFAATAAAHMLIRGFTIETQVNHVNQQYSRPARWENCVFMGGYFGDGGGYHPNVGDCRFEGPTRLEHYAGNYGSFDRLHFAGSGLQLRTWNDGDSGPLVFTDCFFEGPADTGVVARPAGENYTEFQDCTFTDLRWGIVAEHGCDDQLRVSRSRFSDIEQAAVFMERTGEYAPSCPSLSLFVGDSRFERCGQAVRWWPLVPVPQLPLQEPPTDEESVSIFGQTITMVADTVLNCTGTAIEMRVQWGGASLDGMLVSGSGGAGISLTNVADPYPWQNVSVQNSWISSNLGPGVILVESTGTDGRSESVRFLNNRFEHNGGSGLSLTAQEVEVSGNISHHNGGDGFRIHTPAALQTSDIGRNTLVFNNGEGLHHTVDPATDPTSVLLHNNLAAWNGGVGIRGDGIIRHNDSWMNPDGDYLGALVEANLSADPTFCDALGEDYALAQDSPCSPDGPFGQIGALGVGCASTATLVALQRAEVVDGVVRLSWFSGGGPVRASVERRGEGSEWAQVGWITSDGTGMLRFEEAIASAGRYAYRLAIADGGETQYTRETWLEVASMPFALRVANPARGQAITVRLSLPGTAHATVELIDVTGRRVASVRLAPAGNTQSVILGAGGALAPGVYLVRVEQGVRSRVGRVVVMR